MKFDKRYEEDILYGALHDKKFLKGAYKILKSHDFCTKQHGWIWEQIANTWKNHGEIPSRKIFISRAKADFKEEKTQQEIVEILNEISKKKGRLPGASLEELKKFSLSVNLQKTIENAVDSLAENVPKKAYSQIESFIRNQTGLDTNYTKIDWIEDFPKRQAERKRRRDNPEEDRVIPTGFAKLDQVIEGLKPGELGLCLATTNKGKSIWVNNAGFKAAAKGFPTVIFTLEMSADRVAQRTDTRWLQLDYTKFRKFNFSLNEERYMVRKYKGDKSRFSNMLKIVSFPANSCTIGDLIGCLNDLKEESGFVPSLIVLDSADHIVGDNKKLEYRLQQKQVYLSVKDLAEREGYSIWSSTHAGKEWADKVATSESAADSYDKSRIADIVISLNTPTNKSRSSKVSINEDGTLESEEAGGGFVHAKYRYMEMFLAKHRDGINKVTFPLDAYFEKMIYLEIAA